MQHIVASLLALLCLVNSSQCAEVSGGHNTWSEGPRVRLEVYPRIEEWLHSGTGKKLVLHRKNEPLNMTCTVVYQNGEKEDDTLFDYVVDWKGPRHLNENPKIDRGQSKNTAWISFEHLTEKDAGDYTCIAVSHKPWGYQTTLSIGFYLFVEHKPTYCGPQWFRCRSKHCIMERYVCDGKQDCEEGEDESPAAGCGLNPCFRKVLCDDRCIPPEWCCDHRNCSGTFGLRGGPWPQENNEISYVQTAFYTVIGCAMAFMFIVTILVIAICRVQIKRAMNSRCSQQNRDVICSGRRAVPLYDLDVYLNRNRDVNYPGGVSIMCNINSGVQFVGRPAEPPPYSEVVAEPPREGPPPPYVSCENLIVRVPNPRFHEITEVASSGGDDATLVGSIRGNRETPEVDQPDTDIRRGTNANQRESSVPNVPGPQVPTYSYHPQGRAIVNRDADAVNHRCTNNGLFGRDNVDATSIRPEATTRIQPSTNFELEYVETDALLAENPSDSADLATGCPKSTSAAWKPYKRGGSAIVGNLWPSNERRDKKRDKNWYRQTFEKTAKDCPSRGETTSHKETENEGVFLDDDRRDARGGGGRLDRVDDENRDPPGVRESGNVSAGSSRSATTSSEAGVAVSSDVADARREGEKTPPQFRDEAGMTSEIGGRRTDAKNSRGSKKVKSEQDRAGGKKTSNAINFPPGGGKRSSTNPAETTEKKSSDASACASGIPESTSNSSVGKNSSQVRESSLVLPLRESFIGVQRDS